MRKIKKNRKTQYIEEIVSVNCNKCGQDMFQEGFPDWLPGFYLKHEFGYFSKYDLKKIELDICETCLLKFIKRCKIKPEFKDCDLC